MSIYKRLRMQRCEEPGSGASEATGSSEARESGKATLGQNVIATILVLAGFALLGGALWTVELWKSAT